MRLLQQISTRNAPKLPHTQWGRGVAISKTHQDYPTYKKLDHRFLGPYKINKKGFDTRILTWQYV